MGRENKDSFKRSWSHTKMAAIPIYGKNLKNLLLKNRTADDLETWYAASDTQELQTSFSNDDPRLIFDIFTQRSILDPYAFVYM